MIDISQKIRFILLGAVLLLMSSSIVVAGGFLSKVLQNPADLRIPQVEELYDAIMAGDVGRVGMLIEAGVDLNPVVDEDQLTPIQMAVYMLFTVSSINEVYDEKNRIFPASQFRQIILKLINARAHVIDVRVGDVTLMEMAARRVDVLMMICLMRNIVRFLDSASRDRYEGQLHDLSDLHEIRISELLDRIKFVNSLPLGFFHMAVRHIMTNDMLIVIQGLLDANVSVNDLDDKGQTVLHALMFSMETEFNLPRINYIIHSLIRRNISINTPDHEGNTAVDLVEEIQVCEIHQLLNHLRSYSQLLSNRPSLSDEVLVEKLNLIFGKIKRIRDIKSVYEFLRTSGGRAIKDRANGGALQSAEDIAIEALQSANNIVALQRTENVLSSDVISFNEIISSLMEKLENAIKTLPLEVTSPTSVDSNSKPGSSIGRA